MSLMSTATPRRWLGITYPVRRARILLAVILLIFVLYFLGSLIVLIPGAIFVSAYGQAGWILAIGLVSGGVFWLAYRGYRQTLITVLAEAEEVTPENYPALADTVELLKSEAAERGMKPPTLYVHPDPMVNALAIGRRNSGHIVIFDGLLTELDETAELDAIVGHELAHIDNRDSVLMATISGIKDIVVWFWTWVGFTLRKAMYQWRDIVLTPSEEEYLKQKMHRRAEIISSPIGLCEKSISRHREYIADAEGARVAGPDSMISALQKIHNTNAATPDLEFSQSLCIHGSQRGLLSRLRSTHPPVEKRIRYVEKNTK